MIASRTGHVHDDEVAWQDMGGGVRRKILVFEPQMLMMRNRFEAGGVGAPHSHPHVQSSYIEIGVFDVTIDGVTRRLGRGDAYLVPSGLIHGAVCIEAGDVIEVFTPVRADFL